MSHTTRLNNCKNKIMILCTDFGNSTNCEYFFKFMESNEKNIERELVKVESMAKRSKRYNLLPLPFGWLKNLFSSGIDQETIDKLQKTDTENRELIKDQMIIHKHAFHKITSDIQVLDSKISSIAKTQSLEFFNQQLNDLIQMASFIFVQHHKIIITLTKIIMQSPDVNILNIVDEDLLIANLNTMGTFNS